ncbi:uncharacterized protein LOC131890406 isoform X2 [Tigriopus californicus]|nr:uncharacterized protein LOC131890406 isoform X2 [Tigriopus californicus]
MNETPISWMDLKRQNCQILKTKKSNDYISTSDTKSIPDCIMAFKSNATCIGSSSPNGFQNCSVESVPQAEFVDAKGLELIKKAFASFRALGFTEIGECLMQRKVFPSLEAKSTKVTPFEDYFEVTEIVGDEIDLKIKFRKKGFASILFCTMGDQTTIRFDDESFVILHEKQTRFFVLTDHSSVKITWPPFQDSLGFQDIQEKLKWIKMKTSSKIQIVKMKWANSTDIEACLSKTTKSNHLLVPLLYGGTFVGVLILLLICFCYACIRSKSPKQPCELEPVNLSAERSRDATTSDYIFEISNDNEYYGQ